MSSVKSDNYHQVSDMSNVMSITAVRVFLDA